MTTRECRNSVAEPTKNRDQNLSRVYNQAALAGTKNELLSDISGLDKMSWGFEFNAYGQMFHRQKTRLLIGTN